MRENINIEKILYQWILSLIKTNNPTLEEGIIHQLIQNTITNNQSSIESTYRFDNEKYKISIRLEKMDTKPRMKDLIKTKRNCELIDNYGYFLNKKY